jgi:polyisoprenoid-binding protein YceI
VEREHLRSPDFFAVAEHPQLTFVSTAVTAREGGLTISGDLSLKGDVVRLQLPLELRQDQDGRLSLHTAVSVAREQVGLTWNRLGMVRGPANLSTDLELVAE